MAIHALVHGTSYASGRLNQDKHTLYEQELGFYQSVGDIRFVYTRFKHAMALN